MNTPMLPTPPDCGSPCAMCESYAHLLAKAREEIARLRVEVFAWSNLYTHGPTAKDLAEARAAIDVARGGAK